MNTANETLDANAVAETLGMHLVNFRRLCQHGEFPSPDFVLDKRQGYRWLPETIAPWIEAARMRAAAREHARALKAEAKKTWDWRDAGAMSPAAYESALQTRRIQTA